MDIQLEKIRIIQKLAEVEEEWVLRSIKRLLGISEVVEDEFVKKYEANLKPMSRQELIDRALEAEEDFKAGRFVELESYLKSVEP
ncbi:MAG: hypothetical protein IPM82_18315 [Saprospiraceae bacterium]|nr:hypothetical protein [Saprospiraceae bacterium]